MEFQMGWITAGLGLLGGFMDSRSAKKEGQLANQGFNYLKSNANIQQAQTQGQSAGGLRAGLLGIGGDQADSDAAFQQYQNSSGFQFRMDRGMGAITGSRAASGVLNSGATSKALMQFGQDIGSQEYEKYLGQLGQTQEMGLEAAGVVGIAGTAGSGNAMDAQRQGNENMGRSIGGLVKGVGSIFGF